MLGVWDDEDPTVIDLVVGPNPGAPQSPWEGYEHVWHLDQEDVLDDAAGTAVGEFSGYGNGEGLIPGVVGGAREFDGTDDLAEIPTVTDASMVVAAYGWARIDELPSRPTPLFGRNDGPPDALLGNENGVDWAITVDDQGLARLVARVSPGVTFTTSAVPVPPPVDGWHHYGVTSSVSGALMSFYVDGVSNTLIISPIFTEISAPSVSMGGWYGEEPPSDPALLQGAVDEVTLLHRELPFGWLATVHTNQQTPAQTYTLGMPQPK